MRSVLFLFLNSNSRHGTIPAVILRYFTVRTTIFKSSESRIEYSLEKLYYEHKIMKYSPPNDSTYTTLIHKYTFDTPLQDNNCHNME